jgi:hypothetical protein
MKIKCCVHCAMEGCYILQRVRGCIFRCSYAYARHGREALACPCVTPLSYSSQGGNHRAARLSYLSVSMNCWVIKSNYSMLNLFHISSPQQPCSPILLILSHRMPCLRHKRGGPSSSGAAISSPESGTPGVRIACKPRTAHFLRRIQAAQVETTFSKPVILHWVADRADLQPWGW